MRKFLSYVLILGGAVLIFAGARDYLESRFGQVAAAREFKALEFRAAIPATVPRLPATEPAPRVVPPPRPGATLAKLIIPRLHAQLYVLEGDNASELRRGPGHMIGTAMPGAGGNCVIAGHRDTHFRILKDIRVGDEIVLQTDNGVFLYRVKSTQIVSPKNTASLQPTGDAELHLITCYPFDYVGSAPKRFVVRAELAGSVAAGNAAPMS
jgi:sortase A